MRHLVAIPILVSLVLALTAPGCGGDDDAFRVGVIVDCVGLNRSLREAELSGAEMPLIERGASLRGHLASGGLTSVDVGGQNVELVAGCTELWEPVALTAEARRLIERQHVDAIIGAGSGVDEVGLRDVARLYPRVPFLAVAHGPREVTLDDPPPNLYRFAGDHGQGVDGLAGYAFRRLGWRTAAIVLSNWDVGWGSRDAFVSEFCAMGGAVSSQLALESIAPDGSDVAQIPTGVDGVAVLVPSVFEPGPLLRRLARRFTDPRRHIVVGPSVTDEPALLGPTRQALAGVTGSSFTDPARVRSYLDAHARAFPGMSAALAGNELVTGYRDAVEALLAGLEAAAADSDSLPQALSSLRVDLLGGPVRLDSNRQAVGPTTLVRIEAPGRPAPGLEREETVADADQSIHGLLPSSLVPSDRPAPCPSGPPRSSR
jgi:branched-chain amino acid transport system substrate-binding protein